MTTITLVSKLIVDEQTEAILFDAMRSATKVFKGLIWNFRSQYEETGKAPISRKNLNKIMKELPRRKDYYSLSTQGTRDEVKRVEVQIQSRKDVKLPKVINVLITYDKKLG